MPRRALAAPAVWRPPELLSRPSACQAELSPPRAPCPAHHAAPLPLRSEQTPALAPGRDLLYQFCMRMYFSSRMLLEMAGQMQACEVVACPLNATIARVACYMRHCHRCTGKENQCICSRACFCTSAVLFLFCFTLAPCAFTCSSTSCSCSCSWPSGSPSSRPAMVQQH